MPLVHHELCFGCGQTNLFGLHLEAERDGEGRVSGRCFIKQDHQGPTRGMAHDGIVAAALTEAMALACGEPEPTAERLEMERTGGAPVGMFLTLRAEVTAADEAVVRVAATASSQGQEVARARGSFRRR